MTASGTAAGFVPGFVVWGRVLVLLVAAAALVSGVVQALPMGAAAVARGHYVCPMHPGIVSTVPGQCSICNMALVPDRAASTDGVPAAHQVTARVEQRVVAAQVRAAASVGPDGAGTAVLYVDDLVGLDAREPATFFGGSAPNMGVAAHLALDSSSPIDASTVRVRFHLDGPVQGVGPAGPQDIGSLQIAAKARPLLVVPESALLYSAHGPYVLAAPGPEDSFAKRGVRIGRILDSGYVGRFAGAEQGAVVILAGLNEGERVVTGYTFFVDAERRLQEASMHGEQVSR